MSQNQQGGYYAAKKTQTTPWLWIMAAIGAVAAVVVGGCQHDDRAGSEPTNEASGGLPAPSSAIPPTPAEDIEAGTPFGFRKGMRLEELQVPVEAISTTERTYLAKSAPRPDKRFAAYQLTLNSRDRLCQVSGVKHFDGTANDDEVQEFFWDLYGELAVLLGSEGELTDYLDAPPGWDGAPRLFSSWRPEVRTAPWPIPDVLDADLALKEPAGEGAMVEMNFEFGCR